MTAETPISPSQSNTSVLSLVGSEWQPETPEKLQTIAENAPERFIQFEADNRLNGFSGCNRFLGPYTQDGQSLSIGPLASTRKMCVEGMDAEQDFQKSLQSVKTMEFKDNRLTLKDENNSVITVLRRRDWD